MVGVSLVLLSTLVLGDLVNVLVELIQVGALLGDRLLQASELLNFLLVDVHVFLSGFTTLERVRLRLTTRPGRTDIAFGHSGSESREGPRSKGTVGSGQRTDDGLAKHYDGE